jgi:hypothetical protein
MKNALIPYTGSTMTLYPAPVFTRLARVSFDLLYECEREGVIMGYNMPGGIRGYRLEDVYVLRRIYRLRRELDLDLHSAEIVMTMAQQIRNLRADIQMLQERAKRREQELLDEIRRLREDQDEGLTEDERRR